MSIKAVVKDQIVTDGGTTITVMELNPFNHLVQTEDLTEAGVAVQEYGVVMAPADVDGSVEVTFAESGEDPETVRLSNIKDGRKGIDVISSYIDLNLAYYIFPLDGEDKYVLTNLSDADYVHMYLDDEAERVDAKVYLAPFDAATITNLTCYLGGPMASPVLFELFSMTDEQASIYPYIYASDDACNVLSNINSRSNNEPLIVVVPESGWTLYNSSTVPPSN